MTRTALQTAEPQMPPVSATRLMASAAVTYNAESRTVEATLSTGARVARYFGFEELEISAAAIDLNRVKSGVCSLLDTHNRFSIDSVLGKVESAAIKDGQLIGRLRFAETDAGRLAEGMVARGEVTGVSIGYAVRKWQVEEGQAGAPDTYRAIEWELTEVSLVPVPADPQSLIRSEELNVKRNHPQSNALPAIEGSVGSTPTLPAVSARQISSQAVNAGLDATAIDELLRQHENAPFTEPGLRAEIGRRFAARDSGARTVSRIGPSIFAQADDHSSHPAHIVRNGMEDALLARMSGRAAQSQQEQQLMRLSLPGMARQLLDARGENVGYLSDREVMERSFHTTSDFPLLLQGAGNRYLVQQFEAAASGVKAVARRREAPDFRSIYNIKLGNFSALEKVNEAGEYHSKTIDESGENYKLVTFGNIFSITRQAIVNDDLGAFSDSLTFMAKSAAETEALALAGLLTENSGAGLTLADGTALYHTSRGNLAASGSDITVASLSVARKAMRDQKALDKTTFINAAPKTILVGTAKETAAELAVASIQATQASNVNPFSGKLEVVVDPRLPGNAWRLFADPAMCPVIEYAYLSSAVGPQLAQREHWNTGGWQFRATLDFGVGLLDYRGTYMDPGD